MPTRAAATDRNQSIIETAEARAARSVAAAYNQARGELLAALIEGWTGTGALRPEDAAQLLRQLALLQQIDGRLLALEREVGAILRNILSSADDIAFQNIRRELELLPSAFRPSLSFARFETQLIEQFLPVAMEDLTLGTSALRSTLRRELQSGLLQGESFPNLVKRLMNTSEPSAWRNGQLSAERMTRRTVIHANNASKQHYIAEARREVPTIQKQAIAAINSATTQCCLRVHGQIQPPDKPFELTAEPRFARHMMHSPFHWNCRTSIAMYHPSFESGDMPTGKLREKAQAEIKKRSK